MKRHILAAMLLLAGAIAACGQVPDYDDISSADRPGSAKIVTRADGRYYVYDGKELFADIARAAYGDSSLWYLIYRQNREKFSGRVDGARTELKLPDPPEKRVTTQDGQKVVRVIPGDTFMSLSKRLYGTTEYWRALWLVNRERIDDPDDPFQIFKRSTEPKVFLVPELPQVKEVARTAAEDFGPSAPESSPDLRRSAPAGSDQRVAASGGPDAYRKTTNPIASLDIRSATDIGPGEARTILLGTGMLKENESLDKGLKRLHRGYGTRNSTVFDTRARERLFREYTLLKAALNKWAAYPNIGSKSTPQLVDKWIKAASKRLTAVPENQRYRLIKSLMMQESGVSHWRNYRPIVGGAGDTGFGQFLPATAKGVGINPYDPEENVHGIAKFLNSLIRQKGSVHEALAAYNGGGKPPKSSYRYASAIQNRAGNTAFA